MRKINYISHDLILLFLALWYYRCAGAGHLREDIVYHTKELNKLPVTKDETRSYIMDMGVKALRLVT